LKTPERRQRRRVGAELEDRTLKFAGDVVEFVAALPPSVSGNVLGRQLLRSGTSIGANYREANRAESPLDFAHKVAIAVKEAAETEYWLLLCKRVTLGDPPMRDALAAEADQLIAILSTILYRARHPR
jgi:four helix bundle protein